MKKIAVIMMMPVLAGMLFISGCKKISSTTGNSQLAVRLKDAPAHCDKARLEIKGIRVFLNHGGWITIPINDTTLDILQLQDTSALLGVVNIDAGTITKVQVLLGSDDSVTIGGISYALDLTDSDFIISVNDTLIPNGSFTLVVDINAAESIFDDGGEGHHHFWMNGQGNCFFRRNPYGYYGG